MNKKKIVLSTFLHFFTLIRPDVIWKKLSRPLYHVHFTMIHTNSRHNEMMQKAWSSIGEMPYCFSRSSIKFQGHMWQKIDDCDPNWAFPDCNSSLNAPMPMKCCTKLEVVQERCPIVCQGHTSNFKVTRDKKITDFDPNGVFPDCNSSLNSTMAMKCCTKLEVA